jgi:hypothetical protein
LKKPSCKRHAAAPVVQKEVITREVVMIPCQYCGGAPNLNHRRQLVELNFNQKNFATTANC